MLKSKHSMINMFHKGQLDDVAKELRLYGTITGDSRWDEGEKGAYRAMTIDHRGIVWNLTLHNGEVKELGYLIV